MYPEQHNYLIHWLRKGEKAKYIDKVKLANGRWRYFYTQAEIDAYKKGLSRGASSLADKARQGLRNLKEGALNTGARAIVGVANRNEALSRRLGGSYKNLANNRRDVATRMQNEANSLNRQAQQERAYGASQAREGRVEGIGAKLRYAASKDERDYVKQARRNAIESQVHAENREREARDVSARASKARTEGAEYQKKYDNSILGRAEKRIKTDDIRKAQQPKQPARKSGESLGSRASKALGNAREAVTDRAAEALVGAASRSKTIRNATGGKHEDNSREWGKMADASQRRSRAADLKAHQDSATAARQDRKYGSGGDAFRRSAQASREEAESAASNASALRSKSAAEWKEYEQSLLGRAQARVNRKKSRR